MELEPYDPERVHGHVLALPSIQRMLSQLASAPLAERVEIPGLHPDRAPTIVAGVVILVEAMRAFGLEQIEVSEHDILYGTAIAAARVAAKHRYCDCENLAVPGGQPGTRRQDRWVRPPTEPQELGRRALPDL